MADRGLRQKSELIQSAADKTDRCPDLFKPDSLRGSDVIGQLEALNSRLRKHFRAVLSKAAYMEVSITSSAIEDSVTALNGVVLATRRAKPGLPGTEQAHVARRSYGVLSSYALDQDLTDIGVAKDHVQCDHYIDPEDLEFIDGEAAYVRVKNGVVRADAEMDCPAFIGPKGRLPRLPKQLWVGVIDIYEGCGQFDKVVFPPVTHTSGSLSVWHDVRIGAAA